MLNYLMRLPPGRMGEGASMNQMALDLCHPREGDFDGGMLEECRVGLQVLEGCNLVSGSSFYIPLRFRVVQVISNRFAETPAGLAADTCTRTAAPTQGTSGWRRSLRRTRYVGEGFEK